MSAENWIFLSIIVVAILSGGTLVWINIKAKQIIDSVNEHKVNFILIAGGTGSGKTTFSEEIIKKIKEKENIDVSLIKMDFYYKTKDSFKVKNKEEINWDTPKAIDWKRLKRDIENIKLGNSIINYEYNFQNGTYDKEKQIEIKSSKYIVMEGIFALYDKHTNRHAYKKYFIDSNDEIRFNRRVERDTKTRYSNFNIEDFQKKWNSTILPMHNKYVENTKKNADKIFVNNENDFKKLSELIDLIYEDVNI